MSSWAPWVAAVVGACGLLFAYIKLRMDAQTWHQANAPTFTVAAYWMNRRIPHVTIEHRGPTLARVELKVLAARAGTRRAGLLKETGQGRAVDTYVLPGPIKAGDQAVVRVEFDQVTRGREMVLRVTSSPERGARWPRWTRLGGTDWEDNCVVVFPLPTRITTADMSRRIPTQAEVIRRQES